jgi:putative transcriptional regulator
MSDAFNSIKEGLEEAIDFIAGKDIGARVVTPSQIDVKNLRQIIGMTQAEFAETLGVSVNTLRHWEKGDKTPRGPALVLLSLVHKEPQTILNLLHG